MLIIKFCIKFKFNIKNVIYDSYHRKCILEISFLQICSDSPLKNMTHGV